MESEISKRYEDWEEGKWKESEETNREIGKGLKLFQ